MPGTAAGLASFSVSHLKRLLAEHGFDCPSTILEKSELVQLVREAQARAAAPRTPPRQNLRRRDRSRTPELSPCLYRGVVKCVASHYLYIQSPNISKMHGDDPYLKVEHAEELSDIQMGSLVSFRYCGRRQIQDLEILKGGGGLFVGRVCNVHASRTWGFIECAEVQESFGKQVFLGEKELRSEHLQLSDRVVFRQGFSSRADPQAKEVVAATASNEQKIDITFETASSQTYGKPLRPNSLVVVSNLFCSEDDLQLYNVLFTECRREMVCRVGKSHYGVRNSSSAAVQYIRDIVERYFRMVISNTVVSLYGDGSSFRPFHQDRMRENEHLAVVCSFGGSRQLSFSHMRSGASQIK
jgi:hypothetical protein